nr:MAG TPA: holin [Caudoviricetes sp.]
MNVDFNVLYAIQNFLQLVNDNWTVIIVIIGLVIAIAQKAKAFFSKSDDEKIEIAKKQIQQTMLKLVTDAETDYLEWKNAGSVKRAQVIKKIFETYPILSKVTDQEELIKWIDEVIDESLETMRKVFEENKIVEGEDK